MKSIFLFLSLCSVLSFAPAVNPDVIVGTWQNGSGKGHVQIYKQKGKYYGKIVWLRESKDGEGKYRVDKKNADPAKRNRPLIGLVMLRDFVYDDGKWTEGHIYNPSDGKEYKAQLKIKDPATLAVRGYVGFSMFGKTDIWTRVK